MSEQYDMCTTSKAEEVSDNTDSSMIEPEHSLWRMETFTYLSTVYAQILTSMCVAYLVAEVLTHHIPVYHFEGFFSFLYILSIVFLIYLLCYIKREHPRDLCGMCEFPKVTLESLWCVKNSDNKVKVSRNEKSHGSAFIRCGALIFGLGTILRSAFELNTYAQSDVDSPCHNITYGLNAALHLLFTILQMYFLITTPRMNILKFKYVARFGLMHLSATNLCVWLKILVRESILDIHEYEEDQQKKYKAIFGILNDEPSGEFGNSFERVANFDNILNCPVKEYQDDLLTDSSPYLFPFVIEYSLIAFTVMYTMWCHIGVKSLDGEGTMTKKSKLDCKDSYLGLGAGIVVLIGAIISLIVFFTQINKEDEDKAKVGVNFIEGYLCIVLLLSVGVCVFGLYQAQKMKPSHRKENSLAGFLLKLTAFGWYIYSLFTLVACVFTEISPYDDEHLFDFNGVQDTEVTVVMVVSILTLIQITIQLFFINDLSKRCLSSSSERPGRQAVCLSSSSERPGRQAVTFLFFCNATLWLLYTFEMAKVEANPVQRYFYGSVSWAILLRITLPMGIFFRFHSTVSLAEIWKDSYREYS